jgi:hypothetical protein
MPPLWTAFKVLLSAMQTLENYANHRCCLLHGASADIAAGCTPHAMNTFFMKLPKLQAA